jgi:hypothetical protein
MLSRRVHIVGVGLASHPFAKVSAESRKLKSSGTKGKRNRAERQNGETVVNRQPPLSRQRPEGALHFGERGKTKAWPAKRHKSFQ